jgi:hypothetical protein
MRAMRSAARVFMTLAVLLASIQPGSFARAAGGVPDEEIVGEEVFSGLELAPESDLPEPGLREIGYLNGRFLILNIHGGLFHKDIGNIHENIRYAEWMKAGVLRVFATDGGEFVHWDGKQVGNRIADLAPALRAAELKLIVALVNNHRPVPGERPDSFGWMDDYYQLLLPFYLENWRGAYLTHLRQLIGTVVERGAEDVIWAWELGNELHTPRQPKAVLPFINAASAEVRRLDPGARVLAGTMGTNHLDPGVRDSPVARALYCYGPISAYTVHTYDWLTPDFWGDMPIHWDFEHIVNRPCPNGRRLPILVEEMGTSRELPGVYDADQEDLRLAQEINQIQMALSYEGVVAIGAWSAESPLVRDISRFDRRRGLTSYGPDNLGSGSCYRLPWGGEGGARCQLERILQNLPSVPQP